jgi:hypothetical protein
MKPSAPLLLVVSTLLVAACGPGYQTAAPSHEASPDAGRRRNLVCFIRKPAPVRDASDEDSAACAAHINAADRPTTRKTGRGVDSPDRRHGHGLCPRG